MEVREADLMGLCNAQWDIGMLTERLTWLDWRLGQLRVGDPDRAFVEIRIEMAQMQLSAARAKLTKLYKEIYPPDRWLSW